MNSTDEYLLIKDHKLKELPYELLGHSNLRELDILAKKLQGVDKRLLDIKQLKKLSITSGEKCSFAPSILAHPKLQVISLKNLNLEDWKREGDLKNQNLDNIEKIFINSCNLLTFPDFLCSMKNLKELSLIGNKIKTIPEAIYLLKNLKRLHLENNQIKTLPEPFYEMKQLTYLGLDSNPLDADTKSRVINNFKITFS